MKDGKAQTFGLTYCRPDHKGKGMPARTSPKWCTCGYHRRGANHDSGTHHKIAMRNK